MYEASSDPDRRSRRRPLCDEPARYVFSTVEDPQQRDRVEHFVAEAYRCAYGARITRFMPQLAAVTCCDTLVAACGLRYARSAALFVERYLGQPVENALAAAARRPVSRSDIVEVGNLATARPGDARMLITRLTEYLHARGAGWVVFTAVPALRNNFVGLGIALHTLGPARLEHLPPDEREAWGTYYASSPLVTAVRVDDAAATIGIVK